MTSGSPVFSDMDDKQPRSEEKSPGNEVGTINRRPHLTTLQCSSLVITQWDVKEPTHLLPGVGHGVPGVVICPMWCSYSVKLLVSGSF